MSHLPAFEQATPLRRIHRKSLELDDLATPYFRKSVSYVSCKWNQATELRVNEFLESKGVFFVERGEESVYLSRKNSSALIAKEISEKYTSVTQTPTNKSRLSSFDLGNNGLFLRRKLSSLKNTQDSP